MSGYGTRMNFSSSGNILPDTPLQVKCGFGHGKRETKSDSPAIKDPDQSVTCSLLTATRPRAAAEYNGV